MIVIKYMGSKNRIAKHIVPILQEFIDKYKIKIYCEPFVGGANIIDKIKCKRKIGIDLEENLIELFKNRNKIDRLPDFITKKHYSEVRDCYNNNLDTYPKWYMGAIGFLASYNGRGFDGGYAGKVITKTNAVRDYYDEAKRNFEAQIPYLSDIDWLYGDYKMISNYAKKCLIYCDPPYLNTKQYGISKNFNHNEFWQWVRYMNKNNIVIISECQAPEDMICIWEQEVLRSIDNTKRVSSVEKLFISL